jgi:hypothetical protein
MWLSFGASEMGRYFTAQENKRIAALLDRRRQLQARRARYRATELEALTERIDDIRADLGRMWLLAATVGNLMVRKGLLSPGEIAAAARRVEPADGIAEKKHDPRSVAAEGSQASSPSASPEDFLRRLEEQGE